MSDVLVRMLKRPMVWGPLAWIAHPTGGCQCYVAHIGS